MIILFYRFYYYFVLILNLIKGKRFFIATTASLKIKHSIKQNLVLHVLQYEIELLWLTRACLFGSISLLLTMVGLTNLIMTVGVLSQLSAVCYCRLSTEAIKNFCDYFSNRLRPWKLTVKFIFIWEAIF